MPMTEERKQFLAEYRKENMKRIPLDVSKDMYEEIKEAARLDGKKVNTFIKAAIAYYVRMKAVERGESWNWETRKKKNEPLHNERSREDEQWRFIK
jgi:hypothetical protein